MKSEAADAVANADERPVVLVAYEAGLDFLSHVFVPPRDEHCCCNAYSCSCEEISRRAETTTTVLRQILERTPGAPRWGELTSVPHERAAP